MPAAELIRAPLDCDIAEPYRGTVAVIGNLDGVHIGHQALIREAVELAGDKTAAAITFVPHPRQVFRPDDPPFLLTDEETKADLLGALGIKIVFALPFIEALYKQTPEEFVRLTLGQRLGVSGIITGKDFQFGAGRAGNADSLKELAEDLGITARAITPVIGPSTEKYSSSSVRAALRGGDPVTAATLLGRPWSIRGEVIEGRKLARQLEFPTANIPLGDYVRPQFGVYAVEVTTADGNHHGVANIGVRPTVDGQTEMLEVHVFDFEGDLYGQKLDVALIAFLREERKFDGIDQLKEQIARDSERARTILRHRVAANR